MAPPRCAARAVLLAALAGAAAAALGGGPDEACGPAQDVEAVDEASLLQSRGGLNQTSNETWNEWDEWYTGREVWEAQEWAMINPEYRMERMRGLGDATNFCVRNKENCRGFSQCKGSNEIYFGWNRQGVPNWDRCCQRDTRCKTWILVRAW